MNSPRVAPHEAVRRRQSTFVFEVTQRCNYDCQHCYNAWKGPAPYPPGELGTADTLDILDRMLEQTGADLVTVSGGEPLLRSDLVPILEFLRRRGARINLISNGSLMDEARVRELAPLVDVFEVPLLADTEALHDDMSGFAGAFDGVTMAVALLKERGAGVVAVFVATRRNLRRWADTLDLAFALGVDAVMFNRFNPGGRGLEHLDALQATPGELARALEVADAFAERHDFPIACSIAMPPCLIDHGRYPRLSFGFCAAGTERAYHALDPLGNVRPCNHSPTILGNIRTRGFWDMVDGTAMRDFVRARPSFCAGCGVEDTCLGGCKAAAEACCGDVHACDPFLAAFCGQAVKPVKATSEGSYQR